MITWIGSPNFDSNRKSIDRIIIHWIVGNLSAADAVFQKSSPGTSAHYGIEDQEIHQYVKEEDVAYHAGVYAMNQRSIGIEHSATPDRPASDGTYQTSGKLIAEIAKRHNIPLDREHIIGHKEVKATQCPGSMDIDRLIDIAKTGSIDETQKIIDELREARDNNWNLYQAEVSTNTELKTQLEAEQKKNQELREINDNLTKTDADLGAELLVSQHRATALETDLRFIADMIQAKSTSKEDVLEVFDTLNKPVEEQIKPATDHILELQKALNDFFYKRAPQSKGIIKQITDKFWHWFR